MGTVVTNVDESVRLVKRRALTAIPKTVQDAKDLVREACQEWGLYEICYDACVVMSELTTNAIKASEELPARMAPPINIRVEVERGYFWCSVRDVHPGDPIERAPDYINESGRGLHVIKGLVGADNFGVARSAGAGKTVWARFPIGDPA